MLKTDIQPTPDSRPDGVVTHAAAEGGASLPALDAAEAMKVHRALREFDHDNARAAMLENAANHFHAVVLNRSAAEALLVWRDCIAIDPAFEPGAETRLQLARLAIESGNARIALELISGFDKRFPDHARVPGAFAVAHEALCALDLTEQAARIRAAIGARFPDHPVTRRLLKQAH